MSYDVYSVRGRCGSAADVVEDAIMAFLGIAMLPAVIIMALIDMARPGRA